MKVAGKWSANPKTGDTIVAVKSGKLKYKLYFGKVQKVNGGVVHYKYYADSNGSKKYDFKDKYVGSLSVKATKHWKYGQFSGTFSGDTKKGVLGFAGNKKSKLPISTSVGGKLFFQ